VGKFRFPQAHSGAASAKTTTKLIVRKRIGMTEENQQGHSDTSQKLKPTSEQGINEVLSALAKDAKVIDGIAAWLRMQAIKPSIENEFRKRTHIVGTCFSAFVFIGVGLLGYLKVIPADGTIGLLGSLIGYWHGQRQKG